jgi:synaptobrevin family protein YKT6
MKIYAIIIYDPSLNVVSSVYNLDSFSFFQKNSVKEFINFVSKEIIREASIGQKQSITHKEYICHTYSKLNGNSGSIICDNEYPQRIAHNILSSIMTGELESEYAIKEYQDPINADKIAKVKQELDKTIDIVQKTIESVLNRGTTIDKLVESSNELSIGSKLFYKNASQANKCCLIM